MKNARKCRTHAQADLSVAKKKKKVEDHFSGLPNDCLRAVFERLTHTSLDQCAILNKRMCSLVASSRSRAPRYKALLNVIQDSDRAFHFVLTSGIGHYSATFDESNCLTKLFEKRKSSRNLNKEGGSIFLAQTISEPVTQRAARLLDRFDFKSCAFHCVSIDDHFLDFIEYLSESATFTSFELDCCYFDAHLSSTGRERLKSILLTSMPTKLRMDLCYDTPLLDAAFLNQFAASAPSLHLIECAENCESTRRYLDDRFAASLVNFQCLAVPTLIIQTRWLLHPLLTRLRDRKEGHWKLGLTRDLNQIEISNALEDDLTESWIPEGRCIHITGTTHRVEFYILPSSDQSCHLWLLVANFH